MLTFQDFQVPEKPWFLHRGAPEHSVQRISLISATLAIGDLDSAICPARVAAAGIRSILSMASPSPYDIEIARTVLGLDVVDTLTTEDGAPHPRLREIGVQRVLPFNLTDSIMNSADDFRAVVDGLSDLVRAHAPVLVHCAAGGSRSPAVAAAYMAQSESISFKAAIERIQAHRPTALSAGFAHGIVRANRLRMED